MLCVCDQHCWRQQGRRGGPCFKKIRVFAIGPKNDLTIFIDAYSSYDGNSLTPDKAQHPLMSALAIFSKQLAELIPTIGHSEFPVKLISLFKQLILDNTVCISAITLTGSPYGLPHTNIETLFRRER